MAVTVNNKSVSVSFMENEHNSTINDNIILINRYIFLKLKLYFKIKVIFLLKLKTGLASRSVPFSYFFYSVALVIDFINLFTLQIDTCTAFKFALRGNLCDLCIDNNNVKQTTTILKGKSYTV